MRYQFLVLLIISLLFAGRSFGANLCSGLFKSPDANLIQVFSLETLKDFVNKGYFGELSYSVKKFSQRPLSYYRELTPNILGKYDYDLSQSTGKESIVIDSQDVKDLSKYISHMYIHFPYVDSRLENAIQSRFRDGNTSRAWRAPHSVEFSRNLKNALILLSGYDFVHETSFAIDKGLFVIKQFHFENSEFQGHWVFRFVYEQVIISENLYTISSFFQSVLKAKSEFGFVGLKDFPELLESAFQKIQNSIHGKGLLNTAPGPKLVLDIGELAIFHRVWMAFHTLDFVEVSRSLGQAKYIAKITKSHMEWGAGRFTRGKIKEMVAPLSQAQNIVENTHNYLTTENALLRYRPVELRDTIGELSKAFEKLPPPIALEE